MTPMDPMDLSDPTTLRARLRRLLATSHDDDALAAAVVQDGLLTEIADAATLDATEVAEALGIQTDSVRKLARKSPAFPQPVITERRYSSADVDQYRSRRGKTQ